MDQREFHYDYESFRLDNDGGDGGFGDASSDEMTSFGSMFSTVSLLSLLTAASPTPNPDALLCSHLPLFCDFSSLYPSSSSSANLPPPPPPPSFNFFSDPKPEPLLFGETPTTMSSAITDEAIPLPPLPSPPLPPPPLQPYSFMFADSSSSAPTESQVFHHLPDLLSLDHFSSSPSATAAAEGYCLPTSSSLLGPLGKRARADSASHHHYPSPPPQPPTMVPRGSALARQRRQKLSEKNRCLQKLLPWDKKMDTATMYEEAYKYIKFLQAQLAALRAMPVVGPSSSPSSTVTAAATLRSTAVRSYGGLGRLNRNQLLQVLVNSPVAQTTLYSKGCCVFSVEQLGLLERLADVSRLSVSRSSLPPTRF